MLRKRNGNLPLFDRRTRGFRIGGASVPAHTAPYAVAEVARLRKQPLNEVSLIDYRRRLVEMLIGQHGASQKLRVYGSDRY